MMSLCKRHNFKQKRKEPKERDKKKKSSKQNQDLLSFLCHGNAIRYAAQDFFKTSPFVFFRFLLLPSFFLFNGRLHRLSIAGIQDRLVEEKTHHQPVDRLVLGPVAVAVAVAAGPQVLSYDSSAADCGNILEKLRRLRER